MMAYLFGFTAMKTLPLLFIASAVLAGLPSAQAQGGPAAPSAPNATPPSPAFLPVPDLPGLPRVLLLGDSISIGYTIPVRERLAGRANVHRPPENCMQTAYGLSHLDTWLGTGHWDVIHFNFGLHDLKYVDENGTYVTPDKGKQVGPLPQYERNLRELVRRLRLTGACLIFATTTPVPRQADGRVEGDERRYNEVAVRVMRENGVAIDDLWAYAQQRRAEIQQPHNVHFTPAGYGELADLVSWSIAAALPPRK